MHEEIERAPFRFDRRDGRVDGAGLGDVAMADHQPADLLRQRLDPFLQRVALIRESKLGALSVASLGNSPGDRTIIGNA